MARLRLFGHRLVGLLVAATAGSFGGCGGEPATLRIIDPMDGAALTLATDSDPVAPGVQADVRLEAYRVAVGERVDLVLNERVVVGTELVTESGELTYPSVSFPAGMHRLVAVTRTGDVRSEAITLIVDDTCAAIDFVTPEPRPERVILGPPDDTDGVACGEGFETTVIVVTDAGDGTEARVFVNGVPRGTARVMGSTVRFEGVSMDLGTTNELAVEVINREGVACRQPFPVPIRVDCDGVLCRITRPNTMSAFLNQDDDTSEAEGFQTDFEVTTDADGAGQEVLLVIDGNELEPLRATPTSVGMGGVATFGNVPLGEGTRRISVLCSDPRGNRTRTSAEWTVDTVPCPVTIDAPAEGQLFTDEDDADPEVEGIQLDVRGSVSGAECRALRVGLCEGLGDFGAFAGGPYEERVTLSASATQRLCAESRDQAGNVGREEVSLRVRTAAPQLQIVTPTTDTGFNLRGTEGRSADLDPTTGTCEAAFSVHCTDPGATVELVRVSTGAVLVGGRATCEARAGLPEPFVGAADFPAVSLPSIESLGELQVRARVEVDRLAGTSDPVTLLSDCQAPALDVARPTCGATLRPSDDEDPATPGLQYRVDVRNTNVPKPPVVLELRSAADDTVVHGPVSSASPAAGILTQFPGVPFEVGGDVTLRACATDAAGNEGCAPACRVGVQDIPTLGITQPASGTVLTLADDCDAGTPGLQVQVRATTNAAAGSGASVQVGASAPVEASVAAGVIDVCLPAADGRSVPIQVSVTDPVRGTATATVTVDIDTEPPTTAIDTLVLSVENRRGGTARFRWTAVDDAGGFRLQRYEARCADAPITSEALWAAATLVPIGTVPGVAGATQSAVVSGFRPRQARHCALRGVDLASAFTPLPSTPPEPYTAELLEQTTTDESSQFGTIVSPVGDVNGDRFDDVVVTSLDGTAALHFGSATGLSETRVILRGPVTIGGFGRVVAPIGDFNGDGRPDFALSARALNGLAGAVWILFGRSTWPAELVLNETSCGAAAGAADVCFVGAQAGSLFGWSLAPAGDFDGDGASDVAIGAWQANGGLGRQYILLGGSGLVSGSRFDFPSASPESNPRSFVIEAPPGVAGMGESSTSPGDFLNRDGRHDLVVSASGSASGGVLGRVFTLAGRGHEELGMISIPSAELTELASGAAGTFGRLVRAVGDVDGDGRVDVAVYNATRSGQVSVYLQAFAGFSASSVAVISNDAAGAPDDFMGSSIGLAYTPSLGRFGDFDGDSAADLLLGSVQRGAGPGGVDLFYGPTSTSRARSTAGLQLEPSSAGAERVAAYAGDVDGDGFPDVLVGDPANRRVILVH